MRTPAFKWDDLQIVLAVARHGSATQASKALNMTQATISRRLQALEEALGHALFIRTPEGMLPTELAQMLLPQAEQMEQSAFDVASTAREFDGEPRGTVRMALPEDMTAVQVVPRLPEL
ncbi:MAG: LysR family transcriptional regulator, partial [Myxococcota bacterium]